MGRGLPVAEHSNTQVTEEPTQRYFAKQSEEQPGHATRFGTSHYGDKGQLAPRAALRSREFFSEGNHPIKKGSAVFLGGLSADDGFSWISRG
jgi:hypothetical protein